MIFMESALFCYNNISFIMYNKEGVPGHNPQVYSNENSMDMEDEFIDDGTPKQSKRVDMNFDKEKARSPQIMKKAREDRMGFMKGASLSPMS